MLQKCLIDVRRGNKMMSPDQSKNITDVFAKLMESETNGWTTLDDYLEMLEWLDDSQVVKEASVLYDYHKGKNMGCPYKHQKGNICLITYLMEAVDSILELHNETRNIHINNRYILEYYLALHQNGQVIELMNP